MIWLKETHHSLEIFLLYIFGTGLQLWSPIYFHKFESRILFRSDYKHVQDLDTVRDLPGTFAKVYLLRPLELQVLDHFV